VVVTGQVCLLEHPALFNLDAQSAADDRERDFVPRGSYVSAARVAEWFPDWSWSTMGADEMIFNLDDIHGTAHGGVLNGCCGIDGMDGINTFCSNGHEIGTECSDCWTGRLLHAPAANLEPLHDL
jgi:hypothetical protein